MTTPVTAAPEQDPRKTWSKPQPVILPIEETETSSTIGNDGNGPTTGS